MTTELNKKLSTAANAAVCRQASKVAGLYALHAAISAHLNYMNDLYDAGQDIAGDELADSANLKLSFDDISLTVNLNCADTLNAACSFIAECIEIEESFIQP